MKVISSYEPDEKCMVEAVLFLLRSAGVYGSGDAGDLVAALPADGGHASSEPTACRRDTTLTAQSEVGSGRTRHRGASSHVPQ